MKLGVSTQSGSSVSIDIDFWDTVLKIKQKIEKSQGIHVSKQILFLQGKVLQDNQYPVLEHSPRLQSITPDDNPNQNNGQVTRLLARRIDNGSSLLASYSLDVLFGNKDLPPATVGSKRSRNQVVQTEQYSPSVKEIITSLYSNVKKEKTKTSPEKLTMMVQPFQETRKMFVEVNAGDNVDEAVKLTVMVKPFQETRKIPVEVNAGDNVAELRKELVRMQERGELVLPQEGYHILHNYNTLIEIRSFSWNCVAHGDTLKISSKRRIINRA